MMSSTRPNLLRLRCSSAHASQSSTEGIFINPFERGEIGPDLFRAGCDMGLKGLVSKRLDRPYRAGRSKH